LAHCQLLWPIQETGKPISYRDQTGTLNSWHGRFPRNGYLLQSLFLALAKYCWIFQKCLTLGCCDKEFDF
jgi:hypothetical protein